MNQNNESKCTAVARTRIAFVVANRFLAPLGSIISKGFMKKAQERRRQRITPRNLALAHVMRFGIKGTCPDLHVDPAEVLLSDGYLPVPTAITMIREPNLVKVTYGTAGITAFNHDDAVLLVGYEVNDGVAVCSNPPALRRSGKAELVIPEYLTDKELHLYLLVCDREGVNYSRSVYMGRG